MSNLVQEYNDILTLLTKYNIYLKNLSDDLITSAGIKIENLEDLYAHPDNYLYPLLLDDFNSLLLIYTINPTYELKYIAKYHLDNFNAQASLYYTRTDTAYYHQITSQRTNGTVLTISGQAARVFHPGSKKSIELKLPNMKQVLNVKQDNALRTFQTDVCQKILDNIETKIDEVVSIPEITARIANSTERTVDTPDGDIYGGILLSPMLVPLWGQIMQFHYYPNKHNVELTHLEMSLMLYYPQYEEEKA